MIRFLFALAAGITLAACGAIDADTVANGHQNASAQDLRFNDQECNIVRDRARQDVLSTNTSVVRTGEGFCDFSAPQPAPQPQPMPIATISGDVAFDFNSDRIKPSFFSTLDGLANQMRSRVGSRFSLVGHTDSTGPESYNLALSQRRAQSVANYLVTKGVVRETLSVRGVGETNPIGDNLTASGRQQNRRVDIFELVAGR